MPSAPAVRPRFLVDPSRVEKRLASPPQRGSRARQADKPSDGPAAVAGQFHSGPGLEQVCLADGVAAHRLVIPAVGLQIAFSFGEFAGGGVQVGQRQAELSHRERIIRHVEGVGDSALGGLPFGPADGHSTLQELGQEDDGDHLELVRADFGGDGDLGLDEVDGRRPVSGSVERPLPKRSVQNEFAEADDRANEAECGLVDVGSAFGADAQPAETFEPG
ncbi:MAG: hypothetical protein QOI78_2598, partial [Actinomycetota bacterium]|nr:hypothetical protein [Actinomycetota bacterium]